MLDEREALDHMRTGSWSPDLKITDIRFMDIWKALMQCIMVKVHTNQGLVGCREVRDFADRRYALTLKSRPTGESPCNVDRIFRKIKQFGRQSRQGGGVSGIEVASWDLAGKAYGVPVYQLLDGRFRDEIRLYRDADAAGKPDGKKMGKALRSGMEKGFTTLKMGLGIDLLYDMPGALNVPLGLVEQLAATGEQYEYMHGTMDIHAAAQKRREIACVEHCRTGVQVIQKGMERLENYVAEARSEIGYEILLVVDHVGHIRLTECIKLGRILEKYSIAWMEDALPWHYMDQYVILRRSVNVSVATGEDIYLKKSFKPLLEAGGVSLIHPDILASGGILENEKIGDLAQEYGVGMIVHMAETPITCLAAVHSTVATENALALELHSNDIPWWQDLIEYPYKPIVNDGYIRAPDLPGLGIEGLNDEVIKEYIDNDCIPGLWEATDEWDSIFVYDQLWGR